MRYHGLKAALFRVHHHDGQGNTILAQLYSFIGIGYGQIINAVKLQHICYFIATAAIAEGLDHCHHLSFRL